MLELVKRLKKMTEEKINQEEASARNERSEATSELENKLTEVNFKEICDTFQCLFDLDFGKTLGELTKVLKQKHLPYPVFVGHNTDLDWVEFLPKVGLFRRLREGKLSNMITLNPVSKGAKFDSFINVHCGYHHYDFNKNLRMGTQYVRQLISKLDNFKEVIMTFLTQKCLEVEGSIHEIH